MGTKIRLTALVLAVSLTMNMVIMPVKAEDIAAQTESSEPTSPTTESSEPTSPTTESSEPTSLATESSEPTSPTTESSEPDAGEENSDLPEQLLTPEEEETLLEETGESMLFSTLTRAEPDVSEQLKALAKGDTSSLVGSNTIQITSGYELYYLANNVKPEIYQNCTLQFINSENGFDVSAYDDFQGLGNTDHPFDGTIQFADGSKTEFILKKPLFQCLYDSAQMPELILHYAEESSNTPVALFAQEVRHNGEGSAQWSFTLQGDLSEADVICTPPLIGTIEEGSNVSLQVKDLIDLPVEADGNAGLLCGRLNGSLTLTSLSKSEPISVKATDVAGGLVGEMGANGSLTVNLNPVTENDISKPATLKIKDVSATGNAGGLVGKMAAGATLIINTDVEISGSVTASGGDAGGLVGLAEHSTEPLSTVTIKAVTSGGNEPVINSVLTLTGAISSTSSSGGGLIGSATDIIFDGGLPMISGTGSISGANAGGLIGSYTYSGTVNNSLSTVSQNISGITVNGSGNAGGVFGVLNNTSESGTCAISANTVSTTLETGADVGNAGGLIGRYSAASLNATLSLNPSKVTAELTGSASAFGGLIGWVSGGPAYLELSGEVELKGTAKNYGGLIGSLSDNGHMVKIKKDVTVTATLPTPSGNDTSGGLVGNMPSGVLCLGNTVNFENVTIADVNNVAQNRGWVLGYRDNTLVYTDQSGWNYAKGSKTNDIGNWGQVLSIPNICTNSTDLLTVADHKVTVAAATSGDNTYSIGSPLEFAKIALGLQLASKGALVVTPISGDLNITLTDNINLSGTGLTGFQRDYEIGDAAPNVTLTGTKGEGGAYSITLPDITVYIRDNSHKRQGLITKASSLTVTNLEITTPTSKSFKAVAHDGSNYYIGALAAEVTGNITLEGVTGSAVLDITSSGGDSAVGGLIAAETKDGPATMSFKSCTWNGEITADSNQSGLYMGGFLGRVLKQKAHKVDVNGGAISGKLTRKGSTTEARMGAMIGSLIGESIDNPLKLTIDGLTVSATVTSSATQHSGALLSYEWFRTNATVKNVTVKNSSLTTSSPFGGLVYKGSGYWSIQPTTSGEGENATTTPGITISESSFAGTGSGGLIVCHAENTGFDGLYLEILDGAYKIERDVRVTLPEGETVFDEIAGCTIGGTGNGIVSIATKDHEKIDQTSPPNTYVNQLESYNFTNGNTRYYYNLDSFGAARGNSVPYGDINSSQNMVMFSAYSHADNSIKGYFYSNPGNITNPTDGIIDLTGYSYYPAEQFVNISDATVKFAYEDMNKLEDGNKPFSDSERQHYGMHTGIFTGVSGQGGTLNVSGLTLQGAVGGVDGNYGALIRDGASGKDTTNMLTLNINGVTNGVTLDGIKVIGSDEVKPLLINSLGNYTILNISDVSTTDAYSGTTGKAASSLIGNVGSDEGTNIHLTFANMALSGVKSSSIFSRATFLESFRYRNASTCRGVYNFTSDVAYTVGQELSNSIKNPGQQYWFYQAEQISDNYVCGADNDPATFYATDKFLRYVNQAEKDNYHEIDVNLSSKTLQGCGTYSDPYVITDGTQLKNFAGILSNTTPGLSPITWTIKMNPDVLGKTFDQETAKEGNTHACAAYTSTSTGWQKAGTTGNDTTATASNVAAYLRNAYYMIDGEITMPTSGWAGLGTSANPFSGVIVGSNNARVIIPQTGSENQYGGLIKFSQGSVVKGLEIVYTGTPTVSAYSANNNIPFSTDSASFFGGVVGWCLGGDTIIDNVTVTMSSTPTVTGTNIHLTAVGGYVGMVGGAIMSTTANLVKYGGGVVFRGDIGSGLSGGNAAADTDYFYYNPYVGRVLDGYVISEDTALENTDKNYKIPNFVPNETHLVYDSTNKKLLVNNDEGLWLLSAIANSGAGAMRNSNCLAYTFGKARTGTYGEVGGTLAGEELADEGYLGGKENKTKIKSYLTKWDTNGDFYKLCTDAISIELSKARGGGFDMSTFGNGFRGIGISYGTNANTNSNYRLLQVAGLDGNGNTVTLAQNRKEYTEEKNNWTSIGSGLFVLLFATDSMEISNLSLAGTTGIEYYDATKPASPGFSGDKKQNDSSRGSLVGAGMLAGNLAKRSGDISNFTVKNVKLNSVTVNPNGVGTVFAGGLIGLLWNKDKKIFNVTLEDCTYTNLSVTGQVDVGGFIGHVGINDGETISIKYTKNTTLENSEIKSTWTGANFDATGGLIGYSRLGELSISADSGCYLTLRNLSLSGNSRNKENSVGGLVGTCYVKGKKTCEFNNIRMEGTINFTGTDSEPSQANMGLIAGFITDKDAQHKDSPQNAYNVIVTNFEVAQESKSKVTISQGRRIGGLFGMCVTPNDGDAYGSFTLNNVKIGAKDSPVSFVNGSKANGDCVISGVIAMSYASPHVNTNGFHLENVTMLSRKYAAAMVAQISKHNDNPSFKMDLRNVSVKNCTIATNNESGYAGMVFGYIKNESNPANYIVTGNNILIEECELGYRIDESGAKLAKAQHDWAEGEPLIVGLRKDKGNYRSYASLQTETDRDSYTDGSIGIYGGYIDSPNNAKTTVTLVGVSIQQQENTLPMKDFGTNPGTGSYVVRADYKGYQDGNGENITGAKAPYVTTSPLSPLGTLGSDRITGDGASFTKNASGTDTTTPVGDQILADLKTTTDSAGAKIQPTNLNLKYSTALAYGDDATKAYEYLLANSGKAFFGDFKQQGGNADYSDVTDASKVNFPVLTLVTNSSVDANKLIYSWISLLTNRTINDTVVSASGSDVSIAVTRWKWSASGWTTDDTEKLPLKFESNTFSLNKGIYDSGQNRFTLLDVAFADPAGGATPAYHLYIPVIVQKMLRFRFWASAQTGTTYIKSSYMQQDALAAASHGQQVTVLMGFEYKRKQADWQEAVDNGDNLLFGFEKTIQLDGDSLPNETRLTLVDCANQNKVYYAKGSEIEDVQGNRTKHNLSFTKFDGWSPVNLCDMLELSVGTSPGQYYQLKNVTTEEAAKAADATLRVWNGTGYDYYKYYAEEDANRPEGTGVSITVDWNPKTVDDFLREQYYLTIQTPDAESAICNNQIVCSNSLNRAELLPTLRENNESGNKYTRNGNENRVLIGDFFTQNVKINAVGSNPEMSTVNHVIQATLTSEIKFSSPQSAEMFTRYAEGQNLFQSFDLRMQKTEKKGEQAQRINLVPGTRITAEYFLDGVSKGTKTYTIARFTPSFRLDFPAGVDVGNWDAQNGATFKAELTLEYPDAAILAQFPLINGDPGNLGVNLGTSSYLAYTQEALPTTTIHDDAGWDTNNFYRRDFKAASLNYYPVESRAESTVESVNQLGVNGWNQQNSRINSAATYDASALDGAGNADTLRCTLRLKQKATDDSYVEVDNWADYLAEGSAPTVSVHYNTSGVNAAVASSTLSRNVYTTQFTLTSYEKDVPIEIQVDMNVLTGADFEAEGKERFYANYKVEMCVELLDSTGTNVIAGSRAEDYIVYTNARINPNPIR